MFFSKKQKSLLDQGIVLAEGAMEMLYRHMREADYIPTAQELDQLSQLEWVMWNNYDMVRHIANVMHQRARFGKNFDMFMPPERPKREG